MKPVSPIHFFDERGHSVLSADHLSKEVDRLTAENEKLRRSNKTLTLRLRTLAGDPENRNSLDS